MAAWRGGLRRLLRLRPGSVVKVLQSTVNDSHGQGHGGPTAIHTLAGWIKVPKDIQVLIPKTCDIRVHMPGGHPAPQKSLQCIESDLTFRSPVAHGGCEWRCPSSLYIF